MVIRFNEEEINSAVVAQGGQAGAQGGWLWAPIYDPECAEYNTFLTENNSISVLPGSGEMAVSGVRVILNNTFAPLPIIGHSYASAQFIGRGATEVSFRLASIGTRPLARVQSMMEELQKNAREFRRIKKSSTVDLSQNEFLALFGIEDGIVSGFDTETDQRGTNLYRGTLSFTSEGHHNEEFHQEAYMESNHYREVVERLLDFVTVSERRQVISEQVDVVREPRTLDLATPEGVVSTVENPTPQQQSTYRVVRNAIGYLARVFFGDQSLVTGSTNEGLPEISATAVQGGINSAIDAGLNIAQELATTLTDDQEGYRSATWDALTQGRLRGLPIVIDHNPREIVLGNYTCRQLQTNELWLEPFLVRLMSVLIGAPTNIPLAGTVESITGVNTAGQGSGQVRNLPLHSFFVGEHRGAYRDYTFNEAAALRASQAESSRDQSQSETQMTQGRPGRLISFPAIFNGTDGQPSILCQKLYGEGFAYNSTGQITNYLNDVQGLLYAIGQDIIRDYAGTPEFEQMFPNLGRNAVYSQQMTLHPTYPDLDLPAHPATGQVIDTEPDYYFFNDSEEGMLNEVGPEIANEMDDRILAMENSFTQLASGNTWESHYLGRSRTGTQPDPETGTVTGKATEIMDGVPGGMEIDPSLLAAEGVMRAVGGVTEADRLSASEICMNMSPTILSGPHGAEDSSTAIVERRKDIFRNSVYSIPNNTESLKVGPLDPILEPQDRSHSFARTRIRELIEQSVVQNSDKTLTMRRAFPSFKIYFIEDDIGAEREHLLPGGNTIMYFDDLYNYNSVKSIRLVRSRKNPADLLILELTNVKGLLERRQWVADPTRDTETYMPGFEETELENPLKKIILKEGLKVQARLGFTNNPGRMGIKFIGEIVEISFNAEAPDEMTIICQSYGAELMMDVKGGPPSGANFRDTPDVCHTIMCSPELVHFGRFDLNPEFNPSEARSVATSRSEEAVPIPGISRGAGLILNPQDIEDVGREILCRQRSKWILANNPADDNIFAPRVEDSLSVAQRYGNIVGNNLMWASSVLDALRVEVSPTTQAGISLAGGLLTPMLPWAGGLTTSALSWLNLSAATNAIAAGTSRAVGDWMSTSNYVAPTNTIWEIFKEMELRHPGWVAQPRPYGTRMTMFFGQPNQRYWADQITQAELILLRQAQNQLDQEYARGQAGRQAALNGAAARRQAAGWALGAPIMAAGNALWTAGSTVSGLARDGTRGAMNSAVRSLPPFVAAGALWLQRRLRDIRVMSEVGEFLGRTLGRFRPFRRHHLITSEHHILLNNIRASEKGVFNAVNLQYSGGQLYSLKADDSIPDERTITANFSYPACDNETLARRYCSGLLARYLKDVYKGEIVVAGMDIDPLDICFIADKRTGMYGGVEVEQVVDTFTPETGWITEITPDMIVGVNEWATTSTQNAYFGVLGSLYQRLMTPEATTNVVGAGVALLVAPSTLGLTLGLPLAAGAYMAYLGGYSVIRWTQDRQPLWILPLILGDRPYFSGLDGFKQDGIVASIRGRWHDSVNAITDGWRALHLAGYLNDITVGLATNVAGQASQ